MKTINLKKNASIEVGKSEIKFVYLSKVEQQTNCKE